MINKPTSDGGVAVDLPPRVLENVWYCVMAAEGFVEFLVHNTCHDIVPYALGFCSVQYAV